MKCHFCSIRNVNYFKHNYPSIGKHHNMIGAWHSISIVPKYPVVYEIQGTRQIAHGLSGWAKTGNSSQHGFERFIVLDLTRFKVGIYAEKVIQFVLIKTSFINDSRAAHNMRLARLIAFCHRVLEQVSYDPWPTSYTDTQSWNLSINLFYPFAIIVKIECAFSILGNGVEL